MQLPPLSLYIHIPWCIKKCPYCDFNSHAAGPVVPEAGYIAALLQDLESELPAVQGRALCAIFFGGGTPSLFSADGIDRILRGVGRQIAFAKDIEITLEANPGAADQGRFEGYRRAGVNRLSLGVQSFNDDCLQRLGRVHSAGAAHDAIKAARLAGFNAINLDLMYGLPGQTVAAALADLRAAVGHRPGHISWYELTIEPNTAFYSRPPRLPQEDALAAIEEAGRALLQERGYRRYEISAYGRRGAASVHNRNYWTFGDYIGIGAGAHGKLSYPRQGRIERRWKTRAPGDYLRPGRPRLAGARDIDDTQLPLEFMMNALRLTDGVAEALFEARTGLALDTIAPALARLRAEGLLQGAGRIATTQAGSRFLDSVLQAFS